MNLLIKIVDYRNAYKHKHICIVELICVKTGQISERTVGNVNLPLEIIVSIGRNKTYHSIYIVSACNIT